MDMKRGPSVRHENVFKILWLLLPVGSWVCLTIFQCSTKTSLPPRPVSTSFRGCLGVIERAPYLTHSGAPGSHVSLLLAL